MPRGRSGLDATKKADTHFPGDAHACHQGGSSREVAPSDGRERRYDAQFKIVFEVIQKLMAPPEDLPRGEFGFTISKN